MFSIDDLEDLNMLINQRRQSKETIGTSHTGTISPIITPGPKPSIYTNPLVKNSLESNRRGTISSFIYIPC